MRKNVMLKNQSENISTVMMEVDDIHYARNYFDALIEQGKQITDQIITQSTPDEKEHLYRQIFHIDGSLTKVNLYGEIEKLYRTLLKNIENSKTGWDEFKPNFLIRLGFSLLQQKRYEEGLAYILQGYRLDPHKIQDTDIAPKKWTQSYAHFLNSICSKSAGVLYPSVACSRRRL